MCKPKRTHHYAMPPEHFGIRCTECKSTNTTWSEFEQHIWCYSCEDDIKTHSHDIYPMGTAILMGMNFDRIIIGEGLDRFNVDELKYESEIDKS